MEEKWFYKEQPIFRNVTKEEFDRFLQKYPRTLERDVCGIGEPPLITYNDFELACYWPYSVVARTWFYSDDKEHYYYADEKDRDYFIMENYENVFESRTRISQNDVDLLQQQGDIE